MGVANIFLLSYHLVADTMVVARATGVDRYVEHTSILGCDGDCVSAIVQTREIAMPYRAILNDGALPTFSWREAKRVALTAAQTIVHRH